MTHWIWLTKKLGYASVKAKVLIDMFGTAKAVYELDEKKLTDLGFLTSSEIKRLCDKNLISTVEVVKDCAENSIGIITYNDRRFPNRLKEISNPPMCLYYRGEFFDFDNIPCVSVVGQRKVSDYGKLASWSLSARLTLGGMLVVSGGAIGTDSAAHLGALDVEGKTVCFLACGIKHPYLKQNEKLREQISENGCLISEFQPNEKLLQGNFHIRNRLISAISLGTIVVEAKERSGALITAKYACEQGRDVFVITSKPNDPNYVGTNSLLKDGAKPIFDVSDVFNEYVNIFADKIDIDRAKSINLSELYRKKYHTNSQKPSDNTVKTEEISENIKISKKNITESLSKNAKIVYNFINMNIFTIDDLSGCGLSFDIILASLTELEILGFIKAIPGGRYSII